MLNLIASSDFILLYFLADKDFSPGAAHLPLEIGEIRIQGDYDDRCHG